MKHTKIITSLVLSSMLLAQGAFAQGYPRGPQGPGPQGPGPQGGWDHHGGWHGDGGPRHDFPRGPGPDRGPRPMAYYGPDRGPGAGPRHDIYRGGYLPRDYRSRQYVIDDWREYRLAPPPRGYHWVQVGGDYVLAAITTGLIMQILLDR